MKLYDMGEIRDMGEFPTVSGGKGKKEKYYPSTYYSSKKLPDAENFDVGDTVTLHSIGKVKGKREKEDGEVEIEIETLKCGITKGGAKDKDEYDKMSNEEKDKADEEEVLGE